MPIRKFANSIFGPHLMGGRGIETKARQKTKNTPPRLGFNSKFSGTPLALLQERKVLITACLEDKQ